MHRRKLGHCCSETTTMTPLHNKHLLSRRNPLCMRNLMSPFLCSNVNRVYRKSSLGFRFRPNFSSCWIRQKLRAMVTLSPFYPTESRLWFTNLKRLPKKSCPDSSRQADSLLSRNNWVSMDSREPDMASMLVPFVTSTFDEMIKSSWPKFNVQSQGVLVLLVVRRPQHNIQEGLC